MPLYKVWNSTRDVKKAVIACSFAEFVSKVMCLYDIYHKKKIELYKI